MRRGDGASSVVAFDLGRPVIVEVMARCGAFQIVEVAARYGAQHHREKPACNQQAHGNRDPQEAHRGAFQASSRTALPVTISDERLIAIAAGSGSRTPSAASGTATTL